ncbi:hypothetical protein CGLAMM_07235 [Acetobacteraceae bacterium EV16G]|uniref:Uncharacterized protein n=1 Tax=Sorlinia euscelidii TaxID=3081148 RepID=A0ABU7U296_9PROT
MARSSAYIKCVIYMTLENFCPLLWHPPTLFFRRNFQPSFHQAAYGLGSVERIFISPSLNRSTLISSETHTPHGVETRCWPASSFLIIAY